MAYPDVILADSPAAYWRANETSGTTATDTTANGRHGTYAGSAGGHSYNQATNVRDSNGTHGMVNANKNTTGPWGNMGFGGVFSAPAAFTLEAWVWSPAWVDGATIMGPHNNGNAGYGLITSDVGSQSRFHIRV